MPCQRLPSLLHPRFFFVRCIFGRRVIFRQMICVAITKKHTQRQSIWIWWHIAQQTKFVVAYRKATIHPAENDDMTENTANQTTSATN